MDSWLAMLAKLHVIAISPVKLEDELGILALETSSRTVLPALIAALAYLERADKPLNVSAYIALVCESDYISQIDMRAQLASTIPQAIEEAQRRRAENERRVRCEKRREWRLAKEREREDMFCRQRDERNKRRREQLETLVRQWRAEFDQWLADNEQWMRCELRRQRAERRDAINRQLFVLYTCSFLNVRQRALGEQDAYDIGNDDYQDQEEEDEVPSVIPISVQRRIRLENFKERRRAQSMLLAIRDESLRQNMLKISLEGDIENAYVDIVQLWRRDDAEADPYEEGDEEAEATDCQVRGWRETLAQARNSEWLIEKSLRSQEDCSFICEQHQKWQAELIRYKSIENRQVNILRNKTPLPTDTYVWQLLLHKQRRLLRAKYT